MDKKTVTSDPTMVPQMDVFPELNVKSPPNKTQVTDPLKTPVAQNIASTPLPTTKNIPAEPILANPNPIPTAPPTKTTVPLSQGPEKIAVTNPPLPDTRMNAPVKIEDKPLTGGIVTGKPSYYKFFIGFLLVVTLIILAGVGYLYYRRTQLQKVIEEPIGNTLAPTGVPAFLPEQIQIVDGSVVQVLPLGESKVLVDKSVYPSTGIAGFARVVVSPDNSKLCFESYPPALSPTLYVSNIDGTDVKAIATQVKDCTFTYDGSKIVYADFADIKSEANVFLYSFETAESTNLTADLIDDGVVKHYVIKGLSDDGMKVICSYYDTKDKAEIQEQISCEVPLTTGGISE